MKDFRNLDPSEYWKILWRRRWYALTGFVLVSAGAATYSWNMPNIYQSRSTILFEPAVIPRDYVRSSDTSAPEEQMAVIRRLIQSRSFAEGLVQEFQLFEYGSSSSFSMDKAAQALSANLRVTSPARNTYTISYSLTDAVRAQAITKRVVDSLIQKSNASRKANAQEVDQFLDEQVREIRQSLSNQEEKIKQFKMAHLGGLPEQSTANINALNGLNAQLAAVENALQRAKDQQKMLDFRAQEQQRLGALTHSILTLPTQMQSAEKDRKNASLPNPLLAAKQAELRTLTLKYTSSHPDVVRLAREVEELKRQSEVKSTSEPSPATEAGKNSAAAQPEDSGLRADPMLDIEAAEIQVEATDIKNEITKREKERDAILGQIKVYQGRLNLAPALENEFMSLSREHEIMKQQYGDLQSKKYQAQLTANLEADRSTDTYKVIDEANLPEKPAFPDRVQIILIGLGAGLAVGLGAAFGREFLDTTLGSEDETAAVLKLPVLATIIEIPNKMPRRLIKSGSIAKSA